MSWEPKRSIAPSRAAWHGTALSAMSADVLVRCGEYGYGPGWRSG